MKGSMDGSTEVVHGPGVQIVLYNIMSFISFKFLMVNQANYWWPLN